MADVHYPVAHRPQEEIDRFRSRYDDFDHHVIPDVVFDAIGMRPTSVTQSTSWGMGHVIYFLTFEDRRDLVFRANVNIPDPEKVMLVEKLITDLTNKHDIESNRIVHVDVSRKKYDFDFTIQERLGGIDPEDEFDGTQEQYEQFTFETGQAIAKLGQIELEGFGRFDEDAAVNKGKLIGSKRNLWEYMAVNLVDDIEALIQTQTITERQAADIDVFFKQREDVVNIQQGSLVHYDLADHNLRYKDGHLDSIFDWETAVVASPVLDIASCPTWKSHYPKREKLIEGYKSITDLPDNFEELEKIFLLRTMIWKMRFAIRADILDDTRKQRFLDAMEGAGV